ncbi:hypothetical protein B0H14DRAFT_3155106 [Mycena olivaceomarginata]|nr:hypothetical protein B0H14DRAFT_3155106 [Mycena olivaceomarginata]
MYLFGDPVVRLIPVIQFENRNQRLRQALCRPLHIRSKLLYVRLRPSDDIEPQSVQGVQLFNHCPSGNFWNFWYGGNGGEDAGSAWVVSHMKKSIRLENNSAHCRLKGNRQEIWSKRVRRKTEVVHLSSQKQQYILGLLKSGKLRLRPSAAPRVKSCFKSSRPALLLSQQRNAGGAMPRAMNQIILEGLSNGPTPWFQFTLLILAKFGDSLAWLPSCNAHPGRNTWPIHLKVGACPMRWVHGPRIYVGGVGFCVVSAWAHLMQTASRSVLHALHEARLRVPLVVAVGAAPRLQGMTRAGLDAGCRICRSSGVGDILVILFPHPPPSPLALLVMLILPPSRSHRPPAASTGTTTGGSRSDYAKLRKSISLKLNQWNSVVRWELKHQPFLHTRKFLWQEGHTVYFTKPEANAERVFEDLLAIPVIPGVKCEREKFMELFAEDPNDPSRGKTFVWQNSWGLATRTIGVKVMVHGDNKGLVLLPPMASVQVVIVWHAELCGITAKMTDNGRAVINNACEEPARTLKKVGVRTKADLWEGYTPGYKFNDWKRKQQTLTVPRDTGIKHPIALGPTIVALLTTIQSEIMGRRRPRARRLECGHDPHSNAP